MFLNLLIEKSISKLKPFQENTNWTLFLLMLVMARFKLLCKYSVLYSNLSGKGP